MTTEVVIVDAVRSAVGRAQKGSLAHKRPDDLAAEVIAALLARHPKLDKSLIEDVVLGCAMPEGEQGLNIARVSTLLSGLPHETSAITINRFCASGLQALAIGAGHILLGSHDTVIAGGVESMSMVPMTGNKLSASPAAMASVPEVYTPMGLTAENVAKRFGVERAAQDEFALGSQQKASKAIEAKRFADEIVPVKGVRFRGDEHVEFDFAQDELPRPDTTLEGLAKLKPVFTREGSVTAGNASPLSDGAAASLLMSAKKAKELGLTPIAIFKSFATVGVDPAIMGIGPVPAVRKLLAKTGLTLADIDLVEMNEAFASQSVYCQRELGIPDAKLNVNGGAIALGHPLGCTGAKLVATAVHELQKRGGKRAIVTMCVGGGMGAAGLFERV
jgi:acetyl-CoA acyltransferase